MKTAVIAIGVNVCEGLPPLRAAVSGAEEFGRWARKHSFETTVLTDAPGKPVRVAAIKERIAAIVADGTFSKCILYFAGHGVLKAPNALVWLLTDPLKDASEAVDLAGSIGLARNSGLKHVVWISDACCSLPQTVVQSQVVGSPIFPNRGVQLPRPPMDVLYATSPGFSAYEVPTADKTVPAYESVFTRLLLQGLEGQIAETVETWTDAGGPRHIVAAWTLQEYLQTRVPEAIADIDLRKVQVPEILPEAHKPLFLVEVPEPSAPQKLPSPRAPAESPPPTLASRLRDADPGTVDRLIAADGRRSFETRTGFTVIGMDVAEARFEGGVVELFRENDAMQLRCRREGDGAIGRQVLVRFADGTGAAVALLPGYIGTLVVDERGLSSVSYLPAAGTRTADFYPDRALIRERQARVAALAARGEFRVDPEVAHQLADFLREWKLVDPTLGIYAAYAYAQGGHREEIASVRAYLESDRRDVLYDDQLSEWQAAPPLAPFDVELLAAFPEPPTERDGEWPVPLLTQGWSYLGAAVVEGPRAAWYRSLRAHLLPSLWTRLAEAGADLLFAPGAGQ